MVVQRYVIVGTAFGGAWTMIVGLMNALSTRGLTRLARRRRKWILYPQRRRASDGPMAGWCSA